jgi:hypothetical protein
MGLASCEPTIDMQGSAVFISVNETLQRHPRIQCLFAVYHYNGMG